MFKKRERGLNVKEKKNLSTYLLKRLCFNDLKYVNMHTMSIDHWERQDN